MLRRLILLILPLVVFAGAGCSGKAVVKQPEEFNPEISFDRANKLIEKKEYEDARKLLFEIKNRDLTKKFGPLAQLRIADSYVKEDEPEMAVAEYRRFLEMYPDHQHAPYAQYQVAMVYFNQIEGPERGYGGAEKALAEFEKLKRDYPRNPYKEVIDVRIQRCRNVMAEYEFLVGEYYLKKEAFDAAITRFEGVLMKFPDFDKTDKVLLAVGSAYRKKGEFDKAESYLQSLLEHFPNSALGKDAQKELAALKKQQDKK